MSTRQPININISQKVAAVDEKRFISDQARCIPNTASRLQQSRLINQLNFLAAMEPARDEHPLVRVWTKQSADLPGEMVAVDHETLYAVSNQMIQRKRNDGFPEDR
jgi:hypothetical protein